MVEKKTMYGKYSIYSSPILYDLSQKAYPVRAMFYNSFVKDCSTHVLDLGCGAGDISLYAAQHGIPSVGIDLSKKMLERAEDRRMKIPTRLRRLLDFKHADMRCIPQELLDGTFDLVVSVNNTLMELSEEEDLDACFLCVSKALRVGGLFIFDVSNPGSIKLKRDALSQKTFEDMDIRLGRDRLSRKVWSTYNNGSQTQNHKIAYFRSDEEGEAEMGDEPVAVQLFSQKYRYPIEIARALNLAGMRVVQMFGGFSPTGNGFSIERSEHIVIVASLDVDAR